MASSATAACPADRNAAATTGTEPRSPADTMASRNRAEHSRSSETPWSSSPTSPNSASRRPWSAARSPSAASASTAWACRRWTRSRIARCSPVRPTADSIAASRSSVTPPKADDTTTRRCPLVSAAVDSSTTRRTRSGVPTEVPPNLATWTGRSGFGVRGSGFGVRGSGKILAAGPGRRGVRRFLPVPHSDSRCRPRHLRSRSIDRPTGRPLSLPRAGRPPGAPPGALAQLVERLAGSEEVNGSNPLCSTVDGRHVHAWRPFCF